MTRKINKIKREKGITLVALVVTIVIIIILSSVTLVATFGENGIIKKAELARDLASNSVAKENEDMNSLMDEYSNIMSGGGEVPEPPKDEIPPTVSIVVGEVAETSIAITVNAEDKESGLAEKDTYRYYINGATEPMETSTNNSYTFTGLTTDTEYEIKVEAFDKEGNKGENTIKAKTTKATPPGGDLTEEGVPIPGGFYYVGGTINEGVVISDNSEDKGKGTSHQVAQNLKGNQFVWVPVSNVNTMFVEEKVKLSGVTTTTNIYSKLRIRQNENHHAGKPGTSMQREPDLASGIDMDAKYYKTILGYNSAKVMADTFVAEYKSMYESIKRYNGFYIGRYELTGTITNPTSKAGTVLCEKLWYEFKKACNNVINNNQNVKSTMIYGCQWDETMNWLKNTKFKGQTDKVDVDSSSWGNYTNQEPTSGLNEGRRVNNIYDLAGNFNEFTQETGTNVSRTLRGGESTNKKGAASERYDRNLDAAFPQYSSRVVIYIK